MLLTSECRWVTPRSFSRAAAAPVVAALALFCAVAPRPSLAQNSAAPAFQVEGIVTDQTGAAVPGAEVLFKSGTFTLTKLASAEGRFSFAVPVSTGVLVVRAAGFAPLERNWSSQKSGSPLQLVLVPAVHAERVSVTATRTATRLSDTPASVVLVTSEDLAATSALTFDDVLRQVPGFSLFRRSGSRSANPTTQGVSLRGLGASGASRALVLENGVPLNDPFGGWVYWDRIPRASVEAIEVVRGAASSLYGTDAIGGVINIMTRKVDGPAFLLDTSYGTARTPDASALAQTRIGRWGLGLAAEGFRTDGYILVENAQRGRVDTLAGSQHEGVDLSLERSVSDQSRVFARGTIFAESRRNGTPLQTNRTNIYQVTLGADWQSQALGALSLRAYGSAQFFHQNFSAVTSGRNAETLTSIQRVPAQQLGLSVQVLRPVGRRHTVVAGLEARDVRGSSRELLFAPRETAVDAGGRQRTSGVFGEDIIRATPRWIVTAGARVDSWRNGDGLSTTTPLAPPGAPTVTRFADRREIALSPRLSLLRQLTQTLALTASVYRGFRAPTLNELYRSFRVGNVLTLANDQLRAERLTGGEFGASFTAPSRKLAARADFFWSEVSRPVANVTLNVMPGLITRQRQNLGRIRSRGVSLDAEVLLTDTLVFSAGYQFADAIVLSFPANPTLEGLDVPQVARQQVTFQLRYANPRRLNLSVQGRVSGPQFEDDQNRLRLESYAVFDVFIARSVGQAFEVFAAAENLFNRRYTIGRTPVRTIGPPLLARLGIRLLLPPRAEHPHASAPAASDSPGAAR